jgi:hypothetical protein
VAARALALLVIDFVILATAGSAQSIVQNINELPKVGPPPSARTLALGGPGAGLGDAADLTGNPGAVAFGPRYDLLVAAALGKGEPDPGGAGVRYVGGVVRRRSWSLGAYYDGTMRVDQTIAGTGFSRSAPGTRVGCINDEIAGVASGATSFSADRFAGSGAAVLGRHFALGASVALLHTTLDASSDLSAIVRRCRPLPPPDAFRWTLAPPVPLSARSAATTDEWKQAYAIGVVLRPHRRISLGFHYRAEPAVTLKLTAEPVLEEVGSNRTVTYDLPDVWTMAATVEAGVARVVADARLIEYGETLSECRAAGSTACARVPILRSPLGGGISYRESIEWHLGVEAPLRVDSLFVTWRAGFLSRQNPARTVFFPAPVFAQQPDPFVRTESARVWSFGLGIGDGRRYEIGTALALERNVSRVAIDLRVF